MTRSPWIFALFCLVCVGPVGAQGVVVDQGQFEITIDGAVAGTEDFVIRRAGLGRENAVFANGTLTLDVNGLRQEVRPLLSATPPEGIAAGYQVVVTGPGQMELRLNKDGRRYVARISSPIGDEEREFPARPTTHILERGVAHHYYFLRDLREGEGVHVLEPRSREQANLVAGARVEEEIRVGRNLVQARRVEFAEADDVRIVWYDRQGRVLRVEVPTAGFVAERTDVVG